MSHKGKQQSPKGKNLLANSSLPPAGSGRMTHVQHPAVGASETRQRSGTDASNTSSAQGRQFNTMLSSLGSFSHQRFDNWTRSEIVQVLIADGQTLRDENYLTVSVLRSFALRVFEGREMPRKPSPLNPENEKMKEEAAFAIQNAWFNFLVKKAERLRHIVSQNGLSTHSHGRSAGNVATDGITDFDEVIQALGIPTVPEEGEDEEEFESSDDEEKSATTRGILEQPWVPPSWEYAKMYSDYNHPRKGGLGGTEMPVLRTSTGRHCMSTGWGEQCDLWEEKQVSELGRYGPGITNYFKFLKWSFWVFVILSVLCFPTLVLNTFGKGDEQGRSLNDLSQTMVGNLGDANVTQTVSYPGCNDEVRGQNCDFDKRRLALTYAYIDFGATIIVIIAFLWLRVFEVKEEVVLNKNTVSVSSYTVAVKGFEEGLDFSEAELRTHFAEVTGQAVTTVAVAYDNEREIQLYKKRGELMKARVSATQEYRYYRSLQRSGQSISQDFLTDVLKRRVDYTAEMREIDVETDRLHQKRDQPIYAFVTFDQPIGSRVAIRAYNYSLWGYLRMKNSLRFKGSKIIVQPASEPSTIIWENLRYRRFDRRSRRFLTTSVTVVLLAISVVANVVARALEQSASNTSGDDLCPDGFFKWSESRQQAEVETNKEYLHCYCDQYSLTEQSNDSLCEDYFRKNLIADLFVYFACGVVLVTNGCIDMYLKASAEYEKHHAADSLEKSIFGRMFLLKFINTGVVFLFMNMFARLNALFGVSVKSSGDFTTEWYQTTGVSICLVQIGDIVSPHIWKLYKYYDHRKKLKAAEKDPLKGALTQDELNQLHLGPDFYVSHRYAQIMADFTVCYMFCIGMPILPIIAMVNFYCSYWIDKFLFLRYYRSPPRYTSNIGRMATGLIPYAIVIHLAVSIWTLGNKDIFQSGDQSTAGVYGYTSEYGSNSIGDKISQRHTFPLFVLMILVIIAIILSQITDRIVKILQALAKACCGTALAQSEWYQEIERFLFNTIHISYSRAVRRGIIKGLATYNILQNPKYKEAFGITDGFALTHGRVKSLKNFAKISFEGIQELERASQTSSRVTDALAGSDLVSLANLDRNSAQTLDDSSVRSGVRASRVSSADADDNRSVMSSASVSSTGSKKMKKKDKKKQRAKERNDLVMGTFVESDEESDMDSSRHTASPRASSHNTPRESGQSLSTFGSAPEYAPREVVGVLVEAAPRETTGVLVDKSERSHSPSSSSRHQGHSNHRKPKETKGNIVDRLTQSAGDPVLMAQQKRAVSDPNAHHRDHPLLEEDDNDDMRPVSERVGVSGQKWTIDRTTDLSMARSPPRHNGKHSGMELPPYGGAAVGAPPPQHRRNSSDPVKSLDFLETIMYNDLSDTQPHAAYPYAHEAEDLSSGKPYYRVSNVDDDLQSVQSARSQGRRGSQTSKSSIHRPGSATSRPGSATSRPGSATSRPGSRPGSAGPTRREKAATMSGALYAPVSTTGEEHYVYSPTEEELHNSDTQSVQSARSHRRGSSDPFNPAYQTIASAPSSRPSSASQQSATQGSASRNTSGKTTRPGSAHSRPGSASSGHNSTKSSTLPASYSHASSFDDGIDYDDSDMHSLHSARTMDPSDPFRRSQQTIASAPSRPSSASSPRPSSLLGATFPVGGGGSGSGGGSPDIVDDVPREDSASALQAYTGNEGGAVLLGEEDEESGANVEEAARPMSTYVDMSQSYHPRPVNRKNSEPVVEENPMKSPEKAPAQQSFFAGPGGGDVSHLAPMHRRPSPVDQHNIEEFKRGRRSKRASGKTQL